MPRGDGTGPESRGPQTGRGLGYCSGHDSPGFKNGTPRRRRGFRRSRCRLKRFRNFTFSGFPTEEPTEDQKREMLEEERDVLESEIDAMKSRIKKIKDRIKGLKD